MKTTTKIKALKAEKTRILEQRESTETVLANLQKQVTTTLNEAEAEYQAALQKTLKELTSAEIAEKALWSLTSSRQRIQEHETKLQILNDLQGTVEREFTEALKDVNARIKRHEVELRSLERLMFIYPKDRPLDKKSEEYTQMLKLAKSVGCVNHLEKWRENRNKILHLTAKTESLAKIAV